MIKDSPQTKMFIAIIMLGAGVGGFVGSNYSLPQWLTLSITFIALIQVFLKRRVLWPRQVNEEQK